MPAGNRVRGNNVFGFIVDNPLTAGSGTFNSPGLATLPAVVAAHAVVTLDPMRQFGEPEIVIVTVHTASATVATITRGAYGTIARSHPMNTLFVHAPVDEDVMEIGTTAQRPVDPYFGQPYFNTTLNAQEVRDTVPSWVNVNMLADPPACRVFHNVAQSASNDTILVSAFNSERFDTNGMHDTVTNNTRITFNIPGIYVVSATGEFSAGFNYIYSSVGIRLGGTTYIAQQQNYPEQGGNTVDVRVSITTIYKFAATEFIEVVFRQRNTIPDARNLLSTGNFSPEFSATWIGRG